MADIAALSRGSFPDVRSRTGSGGGTTPVGIDLEGCVDHPFFSHSHRFGHHVFPVSSECGKEPVDVVREIHTLSVREYLSLTLHALPISNRRHPAEAGGLVSATVHRGGHLVIEHFPWR